MSPAPRGIWRCACRLERGVEVFLGGRCRPGRPSCPVVGVTPQVPGHRRRRVLAGLLMEVRPRCTPTWRAKCRISGSGKTLEVRTMGCARRSLPPLSSLSHDRKA